MSELEVGEIRFQRAWVAYIWARAAAAGVEPEVRRSSRVPVVTLLRCTAARDCPCFFQQVALPRAEVWGSCLHLAPRPQHFSDLASALLVSTSI